MLLEDIWNLFQYHVFSRSPAHEGGEPLFNPYVGINPNIDVQNADQIRRENLLKYLWSFDLRPEILVVGEAPGWRGCRFSGVPFTSEAQICRGEMPYEGKQSSKRTLPHSEASATIFWRTLRPYCHNLLVLNCIPFHPHFPDKELSNRSPKRFEVERYIPLLLEFIISLSPRMVIAIGKSSTWALDKIKVSAYSVRHPAHGGVKAFRREMGLLMAGYTPGYN